MAYYFFDVKLGLADWSDDDEGVDLPGDQAARDEALRYVGDLARDEIANERSIEIRVRNGMPLPLFTLALRLESRRRS